MFKNRHLIKYVVQRNAVKAVIFDMGGVILPSPNPAIAKFEKKNNIPRGTALNNFAAQSTLNRTQKRHMSTSHGPFITEPSQMRDYAKRIYDDVKEFVREEVIPIEHIMHEHEDHPDTRWTVMPEMEVLKAKAKAAGLWNLFMPLETDPEMKYGRGLTNLEYSFMAEEMGTSLLGSEPFNCSPPDTGNMEVLIKYGNEEQKKQWLEPLLDGKIRSCFGMTEPRVASSDATNIESSIVKDGDDYIVNGLKWWTSMAMHPNCDICIFMGKTRFDGPKHTQQSMILVPMKHPGVEIVRPLTAYGHWDAPGGHAEVNFDNVRVPASSLLVGEGMGFAIAQGRLGPGRIHHCMRLIGHAERCLELTKERISQRVAFGKTIAEQGVWEERIGLSRIEIEQTRLMTLLAAHKMDTVGNKAAAREIAMIKVIAPKMAEKVLDRAIQAHGGGGMCNDFPMAGMMAWARVLRLADGPDEVHVRAVSRIEMKNVKK